jgi:hypothetical protein
MIGGETAGEVVGKARDLEERGFDSVWVGNFLSYGLEALTAMTLIARETKRLASIDWVGFPLAVSRFSSAANPLICPSSECLRCISSARVGPARFRRESNRGRGVPAGFITTTGTLPPRMSR